MVSISSQLNDVIQHEPLDFSAWLEIAFADASDANKQLISMAWETAQKVYGDKRRKSGDTYLVHALSVSSILCELGMDAETVAAAILHDVPGEEAFDAKWLEDQFGFSIARLVDGVYKMDRISNLTHQSESVEEHAESLRKLLLAMAEDVRAVLIKLAERLHDMRTLKHIEQSQQRYIAQETLDVYCPLANRLGVWHIKWELEDLCLRYSQPDTYKSIAKLLKEKRGEREEYIQNVIDLLEEKLAESKIKAEITGRPKHIFSIWKKMKRKNLPFDELYDIRAVRILVKNLRQCYTTLGIVHSLWKHIPKEFDDYIATPKENNYRSLHTAVIGPDNKTLEIQIRTFDMHEHAEMGVAAHWRYKEGASHDSGYDQSISWLRQLIQWNQEEGEAQDFIDRFKAEAFNQRVYVLTPKNVVIDLPAGATALDFAYHIHTEVGHSCRGAKVDGSMVPLTYQLKSGEQVEVLTQQNGQPSRDWMDPRQQYLRTNRALSKVRAYFKQEDFARHQEEGKARFKAELAKQRATLTAESVAENTRFSKLADFYAAIGRGDISTEHLANLIHYQSSEPQPTQESFPAFSEKEASDQPASADISIHGVGNLMVSMANCCKPLPGNAIVGFVTRGRGVTIHKPDCPNILHMNDDEKARLIDVEWADSTQNLYQVDLFVEAHDRFGLLRDISTIISNHRLNVLSMNTITDKQSHMARMNLTIEISNDEAVRNILNAISALPSVTRAVRASNY